MFNVKRVCLIALMLITPAFFYSFSSLNKKGYHIRTVVIDAGHGGHDTGCLGSDSKEKNVALSIALKIGKMIEGRYPDVKVIYTRKTDIFVELRERADIANRNHADIFICIHCNSGNKAAYGVETFVMGLHKTDDNLNVSKRENASVLLEKDYKTKYDGYDPNSPESNIIFNLYQNLYMEKSLTFASKVQANIEENGGRYNRGVKQAGFLVLYKTAMPSVLIETGFLTNINEEKFLDSDKGQTTIATSIFKAFKEYKVDMEEGDNNDGSVIDNNKQVSEATSEKDTSASSNSSKEKEKDAAKTSNDSKEKIEVKAETPKTEKSTKPTVAVGVAADAGIKEKARKADSLSHNKIDNKSQPKTEKPAPSIDARTDIKVEMPKESEIKVEVKKPEVANPKTETDNTKPDIDFFYTVQIGATPIVTAEEKKKYGSLPDMKIIAAEDGKMQRFTSGVFLTYTQAVAAQNKLKAKGYPDAYVTPYYQGKRITVKEAKAMGR